MGRERIQEVITNIDSLVFDCQPLQQRRTKSEALIQDLEGLKGIVDTRKSRLGQILMLAALAVILLRDFFNGVSGVRTVYIPHCGPLLLNPLKELQFALLLAFVDDAVACEEIETLPDITAALAFVRRKKPGTLLFIADQYDNLQFSRTGKIPTRRKKGISRQ
jgi:hypothetical protein